MDAKVQIIVSMNKGEKADPSNRIHPTVIKRMHGSLDPGGYCGILMDSVGS
jgi:hypothetical protein